MGLFSSMRISGSALTAQRLRMDVISGNIANADTTRVNGQRQPYQRQQVVFAPMMQGAGSAGQGLQVTQIVKDQSAGKQVYDPANPDADPNTGMVAYPNVDTTTEMTDMLSATRAYEANVTVLDSIKQMAQRSIDLGRA
ncbi:MAG: flagellar basal body rod protein FlgC [Chloroflexi bacterium]|nr:flagellar basal body rod protein FlgC [Chloroflexota bacterium]MBV9897070.1 flagellar basal body rod protein FlgC [Chloroflexota bacterium]